ncbi:MAG: polysaccharide biosynthesis/export family protein [Planctomycetota bacterium]
MCLNPSSPYLPTLLLGIIVCANGCTPLKQNAYLPTEIPVEMQPHERSQLIPIDYRMLGTANAIEHTVIVGDVLGIHVAEVVGNMEDLPLVTYPSFRNKKAPIEPFVGFPVRVESNGTINVPFVGSLHVAGKTIPEVRQSIKEKSVDEEILQSNRTNVNVTLITPATHRIYVLRQDSKFNQPALKRREELEVSKRFSGTTLYLKPSESNVLTALMQTGGLPGIDAKNEIWVMKGVGLDSDFGGDPYIKKLVGEQPIMLPRIDTKLIRIPLTHGMDQEIPFSQEDIILGDGDVVFLPAREGDHFMTGGFLPPGRFTRPRDRDLELLVAKAMGTGSVHGPNRGVGSPQFTGGGGGLIPPTDVIIVRRTEKNKQIKIYVDLKKCLEDPCERIAIASGDLIILKYKKAELMGNLALNLFGYNFGVSTVFSNDNRIVTP